MANEAEVLKLMSRYGVHPVRMADYSFAAQVALFSSAAMVCGPLGSAFANTVFAPEGTKVVPLIPERWDDLFFFDLASTKNQEWYEVRGPATSTAHALYHRNDFAVDLSLLERALDAATGPPPPPADEPSTPPDE